MGRGGGRCGRGTWFSVFETMIFEFAVSYFISVPIFRFIGAIFIFEGWGVGVVEFGLPECLTSSKFPRHPSGLSELPRHPLGLPGSKVKSAPALDAPKVHYF